MRMPTSSDLTNIRHGPAFTLRKHTGDGVPAEGTEYDPEEYNDEMTYHVGSLFFHERSRRPPVLYRYSHTKVPSLTIRWDHARCGEREDGKKCELGHHVFAQGLETLAGSPLLNRHGHPVVRLFTIGYSVRNKAFDPATHFFDGVQYEGVDIHNWGMVNFLPQFQAEELSATFVKVYRAVHWWFDRNEPRGRGGGERGMLAEGYEYENWV